MILTDIIYLTNYLSREILYNLNKNYSFGLWTFFLTIDSSPKPLIRSIYVKLNAKVVLRRTIFFF